MKRRLTIPVVLLALSLVAISARGDTIVWVNTNGGNWSDASNWNPNQVPGYSDTAVITNTGNYTVTLDADAILGSLVLGAEDSTTQTFLISTQFLYLYGQATVNSGGQFNLNGGTLDGAGSGAVFNGTLTCSSGTLFGILTLASNSTMNLVGTSDSIFINTYSLTNYGTVNWISGDLSSSSAEIDNYGLWDAQTDGTMSGIVFNNCGTFRKSGGAHSGYPYATFLDYNTTFNNIGTVDVQAGLYLTISAGSGNGTFIIDANSTSNAIIYFNSYTLTGDPTFEGDGLVEGYFWGNNVTLHGTENFGYGTLNGSITLASNNVLNLLTYYNTSFNSVLLTNYGTVNWVSNNGNSLSGSSAEIDNYGLWDAQTDGVLSGVIFNNYGTFRKSGGTSAGYPYATFLDYNTTFNNFGTVDVQAGLYLTISAGSGSGIFRIDANSTSNAIIYFNSYTLTGDPTFEGDGLVEGYFWGNNVTFHGTENFGYGTLNGSITLASNNVLNLLTFWNTSFNSVVLTNYGTVNWISNNGNSLSGSSAEIDNYGLWDAQTDGILSGVVFNNYGTFRKSGGTSAGYPYDTFLDYNTTFNNIGAVEVQNGILVISSGAGSGTFNTTNNALIAFNSYTLTGDPTFEGDGLVEGYFWGNNVTLHGTENFGYGTFNGSITLASNNVLNLLTYYNTSFNSVLLTNYGTVNWVSNNGNSLSGSSAEIDNYGLWDAQTDGVLSGVIFNNYGTFRKSGGTSGGFPYDTFLDYNTTFNNIGAVEVQNGTVVISSGAGSGTFNTMSNAVIVFNSYTLTGDPTFEGDGLVEGYFWGNSVTLHGTENFGYGTFNGSITLASNNVLNLLTYYNTSFNSVLLTNYGTVNWISNNGNSLSGSSAEIDNYGLWDAQTDGILSGVVFNNYGTFRKSGGTSGGFPYDTFLDYNTTFNNIGAVEVQNGTVVISSGAGSGTFNIAADARMYFNYYTLTGNPVFTGEGIGVGNLNGDNAMLHGTENIDYMALSGTVTLASNNVLNLLTHGNTSFNGVLLTNYGTVNWISGDLNGQSNPQIFNYGLWDAKGNNQFNGADFGGGTTVFNNYGTLRKSGGTSADYPSMTYLDYNTTFNNPGTVDVQSGMLSLGGSYSLTGGALNFGINSLDDFGSINLNGSAALAGTLSANFNNGFSPAVSNSFPVITYGSETGTFTGLNLPHLPPALSWQTDYGATTFTLNVVFAPPLQLSAVKMNVISNSISFSWSALSGQTYQVQCTTNLFPANWVNLGDPISGTNGTMTMSDILTPQKFYRLQLQ